MLALMVMAKGKLSSGISGEYSVGSHTDVVKGDHGWVGNYVDKVVNKAVDKATKKVVDGTQAKMAEYASYLVSDIISVLEIGAITYGFYHCVVTMFFHNKSSNGGVKPMDKIALSYFVFFILRILNTVIRVRGGIIEK